MPARGARQARRLVRLDANPRESRSEMTGKKTTETTGRLGVAFIGSGFNARFHMQAFRAVRDADVLGVWSPNKKNAASAAQLARDIDVGAAKPYGSITDMVADPAIDA